MTLALFARRSPIARMLAVLRRYGSNAHLYVPGARVPVLGPELVIDPGIDTAGVNWGTYTAGNGTVVFGASNVVLTTASGSDSAIVRPLSLVGVPGKTYKVSVVASGVSGTPAISTNNETLNGPTLVNGLNEFTFTYVSGSVAVVKRIGNPTTCTVESFSVKEVTDFINTTSGVIAGNYIDSLGTTPALTDYLVGLDLDAMGSVGTELTVNGDFSSGAGWNSVAGFSISAGNLGINASGGALTNSGAGVATVGATYKLEFDVSGFVSGSVKVFAGGSGGAIASANGHYVSYVVAASALAPQIYVTSANTVCTVDNVSVKQVSGIHAIQATTGKKPTLRRSQNTYRWDALGAQFLQLNSLPFGVADDHYVCAIARSDNDTGTWSIFAAASTASATPLIELDFNVGYPRALYRDDASTLITMQHASKIIGVPVCMALRNSAGSKVLRVNGTQSVSSNTALSTCSLTSAALLARPVSTPSNQLPGGLYGAIAIKGGVSNADALIIERGLNALSGYPAGRF